MSETPMTVTLEENLWGYRKRLDFIDQTIRGRFGCSRTAISVLDIGCGNGSQLTIPLASAGYRITGVDTHADSIEVAKQSCETAEFIHGEIAQMSPQKYDVLIISEVLEHLERPEELLRQALPFLGDEGLLFVTVPNGWGEFEIDRRLYRVLKLDALFDAVYGLLRVLLRRRQRIHQASSGDESDHIQRFTLLSLTRMFDGHDLLVLATRATSFVSGPLIAHTLARIPGFIGLNVTLADRLPLSASSGWMFALHRRR